VPNLRRLAVLFDVGYSGSELQMREVQTAAHTLGVEVEPTKIRQAQDVAPSFEALKSQRVDALYVVADRSPRLPLALGCQRPSVHVIRSKLVT
jgi:ABC-type uncharacterized transport system substrate-binding protein